MHNIFANVLPIFLIALLGSVARRKWLRSNEFWRGLEKVSFFVLFPAVLFEHTSKLDVSTSDFFDLVFGLIIANLLVCFALIIYKRRYNFDNVQFTSVFQGATRYNSYIFFAIGSALYGDQGLTVISAISPYLLIFTNITAITVFYFYSSDTTSMGISKGLMLLVKSICTNPFILASAIGFICGYFKVDLSDGVFNTIKILADSAFAIGMMIVGASIKIKVDPIYMNQVLYTSLIKLIIMPIITWIILWNLSITEIEKSVGVLFSCLPCASSSYILSRQLGGDPDTMSSIITCTTIFSILSLSLMMYILV